MSGVQGLGPNDSIPSFYPSDSVPSSGSQSGSGTSQNVLFDPNPAFLDLSSATAGVDLPAGQYSLVEWAQIISQVIQKLRQSLNQADFLDADLSRKFYESASAEMDGVIDDFYGVLQQVDDWTATLQQSGQNAIAIDQQLNALTPPYNSLITSTVNNDYSWVNYVNTFIGLVDTQQKIDDLVQNSFGGDEQALANYLNLYFASWNQYIAGRSNITAPLAVLSNVASSYNSNVNIYNAALIAVNQQRQALGLSLLGPPLPLTPAVSSNPTHYVSYEGQLIQIPTITVPVQPLSKFPVPNLNHDPTLVPSPVVITSADIPYVSYSEALRAIFLPFANSTFFAVSSLTRAIEVAEAFTDAEKAYFFTQGFNITSPSAFIESARREFLETSSGIGSGAGLASFAMGLYSRNLEIALSSAVLRAVSEESSIPLTSREFATLQFTAMELLSRSSLVSALPAARFILSRLGTINASSPAIEVAIEEALIIQLNGIVGSGILFNQINNLLTQQYLSLGFQSIGGLASFTQAVAATLSLSILSVALAQFGRTIGMPNLVAQFYAQASGIPTYEVLVALTAGSRILDVLDNPISMIAVKQTLADMLVYSRGFSSASVGLLVNNAINAILLRGGINTFSQLRADLVNQFQLSGFSLFQSNMLANETIGLIRGDLGVQFLNASFGLNFDPSIIAASVVNNLLGIDSGLAGAMLSNTVVRSMLYGGLGSTVRLQNELIQELQGMGLTPEQAALTSNQALALVQTAGLLAPLNEYPGVIDIILGGPMLRAAAYGEGVIQAELAQNLAAQGLPQSQADIIAELTASFASGNFAAPGNVFAQSLELAIQRTIYSQIFQTQREFRDRLVYELRQVGYSLNDASYLANSAALFGLNGSLISPYGGSAARIAAIGDSVVTRLAVDYAISTTLAADIYNQARSRAILSAPFSSEDQFRVILTEEIQREVQNRLGSNQGYLVVDRAIADLASPEGILGLAGLAEQLSAHIIGVLRPDLGARLAEEIKNQILTALLGGSTIDKIESEERRNPLSALNLIDTQVNSLLKDQEQAETRKMLRKLIQMLEALLRPNAEIGFVLQSLMDHPSTFIGSLLVQKPKGEFLDIPI